MTTIIKQEVQIAHRPGLTQKPITVHRGGKIFERRQWVKVGEEREKVERFAEEEFRNADNRQLLLHEQNILLELFDALNLVKTHHKALESAQDERIKIMFALDDVQRAKTQRNLDYKEKLAKDAVREYQRLRLLRRLLYKEMRERGLHISKTQYMPNKSKEEQLLTRPITDKKPIGHGISNPVKVHLQDDGDAIYKASWKEPDVFLFRKIPKGSMYRREVAAYVFSRIIGKEHLVPETIIREYEGSVGSVQRWIPEISDELDIVDDNDARDVVFFDLLVGQQDRHWGNILIDTKKKPILIDNGIAFPTTKEGIIPYPRAPEGTERVYEETLSDEHHDILNRLISSQDELKKQLSPLLEKDAISGVFARAERMLKNGTYSIE